LGAPVAFSVYYIVKQSIDGGYGISVLC